MFPQISSSGQKFFSRIRSYLLWVLSRFSGEESSPKTLHVRSSEYHIFNIFLNSLEINIFRTYLNRIFDYNYDVLVSKLVCNICNNFFLLESLLGEFLSAPWAGKFLRSTLQIHLERKLRLSGKNWKVSEESSPRRVRSTSLEISLFLVSWVPFTFKSRSKKETRFTQA